MASLLRSSLLLSKFAPSTYIATPILSCSLKTVAQGGVEYQSPPPYDFWQLGYPPQCIWDRTFKRFNENTKLISVEGNIRVGKSHLASKIAEAFDIAYWRDVTEDDMYITKSFMEQLDYRDYNQLLPDSAKFYTMPMFWNDKDPINKGKPLYLQHQMYMVRFASYAKALCYLFNTGKGAVVDRSPFIDSYFVRAMHECGLISTKAHDLFQDHHSNSICEIWKPHVIVNIIAPTSYVRKQINAYGLPWEKTASNLTDKFIDAYSAAQQDYTSKMKRYSEVYDVDLTEMDLDDDDDLDVIMGELSKLDLDGLKLEGLDRKFMEWRDGTHNRDTMDANRIMFSSAHRMYFQVFRELYIPQRYREGTFSDHDRAFIDDIIFRDDRTKVSNSDPVGKGVMGHLFFLEKTQRNWNYDWPNEYLLK